jgi:hypothetical protein
MTDNLTQPSEQLFQEIKQLIDAAKQRAAVADCHTKKNEPS